MPPAKVAYLVFDVESVADGELVAATRFADSQLDPQAAVRRYRDELIEQTSSDFIPYTYQIPTALVVAKVDQRHRLVDLVSLDEPDFRPAVMTKLFWQGWEAYKRPTMVSFNGRGFDLPLLELAAFRYGLSLPGWFETKGPNYAHPRYRYNTSSHLDLHDILTNFGASRFRGGLNLAATMLGKPGKMDVQGCMVQDLHDGGQLGEISDYCRCDVLDTYFVFLRTAVLIGRLTLAEEQEIITETKEWLMERRAQVPAYDMYLSRWGDWQNPWNLPEDS